MPNQLPLSSRSNFLHLPDPKKLTREQFDEHFNPERVIAFGREIVRLGIEGFENMEIKPEKDNGKY